jgi:hypothetical protein
MWKSAKVGEGIEAKTTKKVVSKKQRGREYLRKLGYSPKVPKPHHAKADKHEQKAFKKLPMRVARLKEAYPRAMRSSCGARTSTVCASSRSSVRHGAPQGPRSPCSPPGRGDPDPRLAH